MHRDFTFPVGPRDVLSPIPPYTSPTSHHKPPSVSQPQSPPPPNPAKSAPFLPTTALPASPTPPVTYSAFVSLASPHRVRTNGLEPVAFGPTQPPTHSPPHSPRLPFSSIPLPHDPLLTQLNAQVLSALEPLSALHSQLLATSSSLSAYLSHSTTLLSSLSSLAPTTTLAHYHAFHAALSSACSSSSTFFSIDLLFPLTDWLDDAAQCTIELGSTQSTRHLLDQAQDELQALFEMKMVEGTVPPSVDELIGGSKEGLERLSGMYSGQVEGVQKSVRRVMESRATVLEVVGRNVMEWEWRVMHRWRKISEVQSRKEQQQSVEGDEDKEEDDDEEEEEEEQDAADAGEHTNGGHPAFADQSRVGQSDRPRYSASDELVKGRGGAVDDEEDDELTELASPSSLSRSSSGSTESDSPSPTSAAAASSSSPPPATATTNLAFPYKAPYGPASSKRLHPLPFPALPLTSTLSSSVWLSLFSSAYTWDESRDELVCAYEVRPGGGKEDVEKAFKRRKSAKDKASSGQDKRRLLSAKREDEVEHVMTRLMMSAQEVVEAVLSVDVERLSVDKVSQLVDVLPTEEETAALSTALAQSPDSSDSVLSSLSPASLLLASLISPIKPSLITRLRCLHFHYQLPALSSSLLSSFGLLQAACTEVRDSKQLTHLLAVVLELFNFLHPHQVAYAFDLSLLPSLSSLSTPSSPSFLTFLVSYLAHHFPSLPSFPASLPSLHRASHISPTSLTLQHSHLTSHLSSYRQLLDDLDTSDDPDDRASRLGWLPLYEKAVELMERVEKRMATAVAKAEALCRWLCWEGRKGKELKEEEALEVAAGKRLLSCDAYGLLQTLEEFVADFIAQARKEERKRRRKETFRVNVKEEKIKAEVREQERRRREEEKMQASAPSPPPGPREYSEPVHSAVLYSPYAGQPSSSPSTFSDLHEQHEPPTLEVMSRAPSIIATPSSSRDEAPPPMLSQVFRDSRASSAEASPMKRGTPVFSVGGGGGSAAASQRGSAAESRAGSARGSGVLTPGGHAMSPIEFAASVVEADEAARRRSSAGSSASDALVSSGMYVRNEAHDIHMPTPMPVKVVRMPFSSHFTYQQ